MNRPQLTWEQAVQWLKAQPDQQELVRDCYYDDPVEHAAQRYASSEEWLAIRALLAPYLPTSVLDIGAGRGISSYAFARAGCSVVAVEPDQGPVVGAGAIARLAAATGERIEVINEHAEHLPLADDQFGVVYGRAVLHHARDLRQLCAEAARVLKPGGVLCATREHVLSRKEDLTLFLERHALHFLYGGEHAYTLTEYLSAIHGAGLKIVRIIRPHESVINYAPTTCRQFEAEVTHALGRRIGRRMSERMARMPATRALYGRWKSFRDTTPGRLFSFLALKP